MSLRILKFLSVVAVLLSSLPANAGERIMLWGIYNGCERVPEFDRLLERHLSKAGISGWPLSSPPSACQGEVCAQKAQAVCGLTGGQILGGRIWRSKTALRARLWLYDFATQKTAYEDEYCQDCDVNQLLVEVTDRMRQNPKFGMAAGTEPSYCAAGSSASRPDARRSKLYFLVYGEGKGRAQVQTGVKEMLTDTLRPVHAAAGEKKQYSHDDLMRVLGQQKEGQVLGVELYKEGGAQVWLFDGLTEHLASEEVKCKECKTEDLIQSIRSTLPELWGHCFDTQCSLAVGKPPSSTEVCEPTKELTCNEVSLLPLPNAVAAGAIPIVGIDPILAKLVKGSMWGLFGASAATGATLTVLNGTSLATAPGRANTMGDAAWTAIGITTAILAVTIPVHITVSRAEKAALRTASPTNSTQQFKCPN